MTSLSHHTSSSVIVCCLSVELAFQASFSELGDVDVLVNCAGTSVSMIVLM